MAEPTDKSSTYGANSKAYVKSWSFNNNGTVSGVATTDYNGREEWTNTFSGGKNPHWRARVRRVLSATTPASGAKYVVTYGGYLLARSGRTSYNKTNPGQYMRRLEAGGTLYSSGAGRPKTMPPLGAAPAQTADNQAISRLYSQLSAFESSLNAGEDLGEIGSTLKMLQSPFKPLRDLTVQTMRKHERAMMHKRTGDIAKSLVDTYLEWNFGVAPLINSVANAVVGLQGRDHLSRFKPFSATGKTVSDGVVNDKLTVIQAPGLVSMSGTRTGKRVTSVRYHGVWGVHVNVNKRGVEDVLSLRAKDVIPTAWNLIPYSWAIDYCTNIGSILNGFAVPWDGVRWCNRTERVEYTNRVELSGTFTSSLLIEDNATIKPGYWQCIGTRFQRRNQEELPRPRLEIRPLANGKQFMNLAAVVFNRLPIIRNLMNTVAEGHPTIQAAYAEARRRSKPKDR